MPNPCETCAFGSAGAAQEPYNALRGTICSLGAVPFFCHHGRDGQEYDWQDSPLGPLQLHPTNRKLCAGWQAEVSNLKQRGYFGEYRPIRRAVARAALNALERYLNKDLNLHKKQRAQMLLERCIRFLAARDIGDKEIPL